MIAAGREVGCSRTAPHLSFKTLHTLLTLKAGVLRRFAEVRCVHTEASSHSLPWCLSNAGGRGGSVQLNHPEPV